MKNHTTQITAIISSFMNYCTEGKMRVYNEISLQLELGNYLRNQLKDFNVRFERNIEFYAKELDKAKFTKREIDIVLFKGEDETKPQEIYAIELKFPRNGQYPEEMYAFIKDIKFMEEVKSELNFTSTYCLTLVDDHNFYSPNKRKFNNIYQYFRHEDSSYTLKDGETINKPTGSKQERESNKIKISQSHIIKWEKLGQDCDWIECRNNKDDEFRYYLINI